MLRVADSAKMFPFSLAVCQILLLSNPGECHQHAISTDLSSFTHSNSALCLFFFFFLPSSFRVSQPLTFNCWVSAKHLCVWHQIWQSPRKRIHGHRDSQGYLLCLNILLCHYFILKVHFYFSHRVSFQITNFHGCLFLHVPSFWNVHDCRNLMSATELLLSVSAETHKKNSTPINHWCGYRWWNIWG